MKATAIYGLGENMKMLVNEETSGGVVTTYVGLADLYNDNDRMNYKSLGDTSRAIWRIKKTVETTVGNVVTTETFYPVINGKPSNRTLFIWDDILTLTYL